MRRTSSSVSSSARKFCTTVGPAATGIGGVARNASFIGWLMLASMSLSIALAPARGAEPPMPPLPLFESVPPAGVILGEPAVDEAGADVTAEELPTTDESTQPVPTAPEPAAEVQLVTADLVMVDVDAKAGSEKDKEDQKEREAAKNACGEQSKDCKQALKNLRDDGIETIALDIRVGGRPGSDYPCECRLEGETFQPRRFATTMMTWKAAGNCHKPLYFEDWNLERYGHSHGPLDPVFSAAHFFVTLPVLPYKMGVELPWECVYPLGYYRPGSCAPWTVPAVPISCRGFAVEAATVTGLVFLLP
jgi:hypothetical protein